MSEATADARLVREPAWRIVACFLLTLAGLQLVVGDRVQPFRWDLTAEKNLGVAEANAWLHGQLDLGNADTTLRRPHDTALKDGRVFNVFPPLVSALTVVLAPLHKLLLGASDRWLPILATLVALGPLPVLGYFLLRRESSDSAWGGLLTLSWIGGTALLPVLTASRFGDTVHLNQVLSQAGLLILAGDLIGRQRVWPGLIGLWIATWTRPITFLYAISVFIVSIRRQRIVMCAVGLALIAGPLLVLNSLKFGSPLDFGYAYVYAGRYDPIAARAAAHGLFSLAFLPENAWYMFAAPPEIEISATSVRIVPNVWGTSIWITSPILLLALLSCRRWWADGRRRLAMLGTLPVILGDLCYHNTGFVQPGYSRFALDFIPIWMLVIAADSRNGWRAWYTLAATAWGLLYFHWIVPIS